MMPDALSLEWQNTPGGCLSPINYNYARLSIISLNIYGNKDCDGIKIVYKHIQVFVDPYVFMI